jgi:hypothetical protein
LGRLGPRFRKTRLTKNSVTSLFTAKTILLTQGGRVVFQIV